MTDQPLPDDLEPSPDPGTGEALVDLGAVADNVRALTALSGRAVMAVVKADAYGHGLVPCARAALAGGASWLAVAQLDEALRLRSAGIDAPLLAWLFTPAPEPIRLAVAAQVALGVSNLAQLESVVAAAEVTGQVAELHIKVDTGLRRNGVPVEGLPALAEACARAEQAGLVSVTGVFSHLAWADEPAHPTVDAQAALFVQVVDTVRAAGLRPTWRHLANSAATLTRPDLHLDMVRPGLAVYGLSPVPDLGSPADFGLRPAMTVRGRLVQVRPAGPGEGVSYGHDWAPTRDTVLGLLPLGYADGLPRSAGNRAEVLLRGPGPERSGLRARRVPVVGRICMDQLVLDLGPGAADMCGEAVVVLGPGDSGEPTAEDWAAAAGTISYEIVARMGSRLPRRYVGGGGGPGVGAGSGALPATGSLL